MTEEMLRADGLLSNEDILKIRSLTDTVSFYYADLETEICREAKKSSGGYTTGREPGAPAPVNLGALEIKKDINRALQGLLVFCSVGIRRRELPALADYVGRHVWAIQKNTTPAHVETVSQLILQLEEATHRMVTMIDSRPEIVTYGKCTSCLQSVKAPEGYENIICRGCGTRLNLTEIKETQYEKLMDNLSGSYMPAPVMVMSLKLLDKTVTTNQLSAWKSQGKLKDFDGRKYSFDEVLDVVERRDLKRAKIGS